MHNRDKSFEAAVKYFTMGALAAGFYSFGSMVFYALTGSVEIHQIASVLSANHYADIGYVLVGVVFMLGALGFKLSLVPFHTWAPDVYEGASASMAGYMSIVPKIAVFIVAMRVFEFLIHSGVVWLEVILYVVVIVTMTAANMWALVQTDVKRMLAYSSISHAGFVMAAILIGTSQSNSALFISLAFEIIDIQTLPNSKYLLFSNQISTAFIDSIKISKLSSQRELNCE
jgi:NADH-quinone oxidoreductase subunit N